MWLCALNASVGCPSGTFGRSGVSGGYLDAEPAQRGAHEAGHQHRAGGRGSVAAKGSAARRSCHRRRRRLAGVNNPAEGRHLQGRPRHSLEARFRAGPGTVQRHISGPTQQQLRGTFQGRPSTSSGARRAGQRPHKKLRTQKKTSRGRRLTAHRCFQVRAAPHRAI